MLTLLKLIQSNIKTLHSEGIAGKRAINGATGATGCRTRCRSLP
jgi:hypothetical protein